MCIGCNTPDVAPQAAQEAPDYSSWGRPLWRKVHQRAIRYKGDSDAERRWLFVEVPSLIPCDECRANWLAMLAQEPPPLDSGWWAYFFQTVRWHNHTTRGRGELHKLVSAPRAFEIWRQPGDPVIGDNGEVRGRIVRANASGLFYNLAKVLHTIRLWPGGPIEVDWTPRFSGGFKYGSSAGENVWDVLFEPLGKVSNPIAAFDRHPSDADGWISDNIARFYRSSDPTWRYLLNAAWRRIKLQPETQRLMNEAAATLPPGPRVGCHVRNDHHKGEQPSRKMPSLAQMADAVEARRVGVAKVVLATDNDEAVRFFRQRFGDQLYVAPATRARLATDQPIDATAPASIENAYEVLADAWRLMNCDHLVHVCSNVSTFAMVVNPELAHTFVEA